MDNRPIDAKDPPCQGYYIINENDYLLLRGDEFSMIRVNVIYLSCKPLLSSFVRSSLSIIYYFQSTNSTRKFFSGKLTVGNSG
jgi:hypothetical protein